jgi:hypothetical protein
VTNVMGEMRYREYPIRPTLTSFVKCIWSLKSVRPIDDLAPERESRSYESFIADITRRIKREPLRRKLIVKRAAHNKLRPRHSRSTA